jgi:hypothetical protein
MSARTRIWLAAVVLSAFIGACDRSEPKIEDQPGEPVIEPAAPGEDVAPLTPPAAPVYYGVWAADEDWCANAPGSSEKAPIAFTEGEFVGYENRCHIGDAQEGTDGGYQLALVCTAEGIETVETLDVDVDGEMLRLKWHSSGGEAVFVRCKEEE